MQGITIYHLFRFYQLYVVDYGANYKGSQLTNRIPDSMFKNKRIRRSSENPKVYVTAEVLPKELPREIIVGDGSKIGDYENKRLTPGHTYRFFSRSYVKQDSEYIYKSSNLTRAITLDRKPVEKKEDNKDNKTTAKMGASNTSAKEKSGGNGALIAGIIVSLLLVVVVVVLAIYFKRYPAFCYCFFVGFVCFFPLSFLSDVPPVRRLLKAIRVDNIVDFDNSLSSVNSNLISKRGLDTICQ